MKKVLAGLSLALGLTTAALAQASSAVRLDQYAVRLDGGDPVTTGDIESVALAFSARFSVAGTPCTTGACSFTVTDLWQFKEEGTAIAGRRYINCLGAGITCTDDPGNDETEITVAGGGGAPTDADYLVGTTNAGLSAEIVAGAGVATWFATPSSANLASAVTGETGSGALVFGTSPTIATPTITGPITGGVATLCALSVDATVIANTTTATDFDKTCSIAGNTLAVGDVVRVYAAGIYAEASAMTINFAVQFGSGSVAISLAGVSPDSAGDWHMTGHATVRAIGASGTISKGGGLIALPGGADRSSATTPSTFTLDTTAAQTVQINVEMSVANAGNTVTLETLVVELLRPTTVIN